MELEVEEMSTEQLREEAVAAYNAVYVNTNHRVEDVLRLQMTVIELRKRGITVTEKKTLEFE